MKPEDLKEKIADAIVNEPFDGSEYLRKMMRKIALEHASAVLSAILDAGCTIVPKETEAELELLEEVCAIYAKDEDRYLKENGEPYGSIPTECGMKARSAAQRFYDREASASPFSTTGEG